MTRANTLFVDDLFVVDTDFVTLAEVEHSLLALGRRVDLPSDATVCTHEVRDGAAHYAVSFDFTVPPGADLLDVLERHFRPLPVVRATTERGDSTDLHDSAVPASIGSAVTQVRGRDGGRAVFFPGWRQLTGTVAVGDVLTASAIDRLHLLGGGSVEPTAELHTRDFVRPRWRNGELVLAVLPAAGGGVAPFEVPNPTPCCSAHH